MWDNILTLDAAISNRLRIAEKPGCLRSTAIFLAHSGDSWFWLIGLSILWIFGAPVWKNWALVTVLSILGTAATVMFLKFTIRRRRPTGEWGSIYRRTDPHSFPSGHAARAALLVVIGLGLGPAWFGGIMLFWAPLVSLARVFMGLHYLSDVIAGAIFGTLCGLLVLAIV